MTHIARIYVSLKEGVLDTQGKAVAHSLQRLGHDSLKDARIGRYIQLRIDAPDTDEARTRADAMCRELLVNDLIEEYTMELEPCE